MRISDWSSDVCSSDLDCLGSPGVILTSELRHRVRAVPAPRVAACDPARGEPSPLQRPIAAERLDCIGRTTRLIAAGRRQDRRRTELPRAAEKDERSEEHTSELQSLMRISYAVFCLKKKTQSYTFITNLYIAYHT